MRNRGRFVVVVILASIAFTSFIFYFYNAFTSPNVLIHDGDQNTYIYIPEGTDFHGVLKNLEKGRVVQDGLTFAFVSKVMGYQDNVKPGRYLLTPRMTNRELVRLLRSGKRDEVPVTFSVARKVNELPSVLCKDILAREDEFSLLLKDSAFLAGYGFDTNNVMAMFVPNTYKVYWDSDAKGLFARMNNEYKKFWNAERTAKASELRMSPIEVTTLASIVQSETIKADERPKVAGLYLNRLDRGILLQADPTVVFAVGDFSLARVLNKHLQVDSPYNTYMYKGLPPGPVAMAEVNSIDAVLNSEKHDYIFMCSKGDGTGYHNFAKSNRQHNTNRTIYANNLRKRGLR